MTRRSRHSPSSTGEVVFAEVAGERGILHRREFGADLGFLLAFAHQSRFGALAEHDRQRVDEDRFAGAGLAGQHGEAGLEFQVEPVDDDEIADA